MPGGRLSTRRSVTLVLGLALAGASVATGQGAFPAPIGVRVPVQPTPIDGMGKTWLAYELHLTSFAPVAVTVKKIEVFGDQGGKPLATWSGAELGALRLWPNGTPDSTGGLAAGASDVVFVWLLLPLGAHPARLNHVVTVEAEGTSLVMNAAVPVNARDDAPLFGPPLRGGGWIAAFGPANPNGHQRTIIPIHGRAAVVQRYAIDFYRLNDRGHLFTGDTALKKDYYAYGAEVLAVADGRIAVVRNDQAENATPSESERTVPITLQTIGGNYVMLDIGRGRYVFYAHLQTGSVRVRVGDRVKRGQVLGLLGLSGNTPAPHLHLHVGDTIEPIGSEGLPYRFDRFWVEGTCDPPPGSWGWPQGCRTAAPNLRQNEIPLSWNLIRFPD